jgi:plastocyanin
MTQVENPGRRRHPIRFAVILGVSSFCAGVALAAETHLISQLDRNFALREIEIAEGDMLRFTNDDKFLHQIYVSNPSFTFDSAEQAPGQVIDLRLPRPGFYVVRCHIHPKMRLDVTVK